MTAIIKGVQRVNYTSKKTGKPVDGVTLHLERRDANVVGLCADPLYMSTQNLENLGCSIPEAEYKSLLGHTIEFEYNRFGMVASLVIGAPAEPTPPDNKKQ